MPTWLYGAYRTGLQFVWAAVVAWAVGRGWTLPSDIPAWADEAVFGVVMAAFVAVVQWLETRPDTGFGRFTRALAKWLMLGAPKVVNYSKPADESVEYLRTTR